MYRQIGIAFALAALLGSGLNLTEPELLSPEARRPGRTSIVPIVVHGATESQSSRLELALRRFANAGLDLPPLTVTFHPDEASCEDHPGIFRSRGTSVEIGICSETLETVYEHELAHAWAFHNLDDEKKQAFMDHLGYKTWSDFSVDWNQRGIEGVATVIQQGVSGLPLPPFLSPKTRLRIQAYRILTGTASPRYVEWLASSRYAWADVACWIPIDGSQWMVQ